MKKYVIVYNDGGFSDGFTIDEVIEESKNPIVQSLYGGIEKYFAMPEFDKDDE